MERYIKAVVTKGKDWSFESEFRLHINEYSPFLSCEQGLLFYNGFKDFFTGLIIGLKNDIPNAYVRKIVLSSQFSNAFIARASIHPNKYKMRISPPSKKDIVDTNLQELEAWKTQYQNQISKH